MMTPYRPPRRPFLAPLALVLLVARAFPAAAQPVPLPGVGAVGQGIEWSAVLGSSPLLESQAVVFVARGVVGAEAGREIGRLTLSGQLGGFVAGAGFPAVGGGGMRVALFDLGPSPVAVVPVAAAETFPVTIGLGGLPAGSRVTASLFQLGVPGSATGEVVPAPAFELRLGTGAEVVVGGESYQARTVRFLANGTFPPPGAPSAILEEVEVRVDGASVEVLSELVEPGALFSGVPVQPQEGTLGVVVDPARGAISEVTLDAENGPAVLVTGNAAGAAVAWEAADLAAGAPGAVVDLAAIGQNIASVEVRGVGAATRTAGGWDLSFQPPGGLAGVPRTVEVDGQPVGQVTVPAPSGVFARAAEPPSGAAVFPVGFEEGAFYGFSWDAPVAIEVPGAGSFPGREVRLVLPLGVGPLAFAGVSFQQLPELTLTGLAAPAIDDGGPCLASATRLCLAGGRFGVEVAWADPFGGAGPGVAVPLTGDTGAFWFFGEENLELMVKVLDACPVNGHAWAFAGGLTNVEVELTVTDTRTGAERTYRNPQGRAFQPIQDTAAFACTP